MVLLHHRAARKSIASVPILKKKAQTILDSDHQLLDKTDVILQGIIDFFIE
jgi:hypothetical protein